MKKRFEPRQAARAGRFAGMRLVAGGAFRMGSDDHYPDERPARRASVGDFWIDETPVTNAQFARFVRASGYVTFAERCPDPTSYPEIDPALIHAGSAVFMPPSHPVDVEEGVSWWHYLLGACWSRPYGLSSNLTGIGRHPVVHIAYVDACAYAEWAGKTLPTEAEWEFAARGGIEGATFAWGEEFKPGGHPMAKTWEGIFPCLNLASPGSTRTAPVKSYPANGYGLYDMIGNVWEWTADHYDKMEANDRTPRCCGGSETHRAPVIPHMVLKGGSHLCAPNYCQRYRPAARWPQPIDTTTSHVGFRCVIRHPG